MTPGVFNVLGRFNPAQGGVRGMRIIATGLLVLMAAIYAAARAAEQRQPIWGFVRAFAEAAMVGGLADWFAVTALFRHPLGLPIPHTAIIPRNKDRIGENLAIFLKDNFLTPSVVTARLDQIDFAGAAGRWLANPPVDGAFRRGAARALAQVLQALDDRVIAGTVKRAAASGLQALEVSPLIGSALAHMIDGRRHVPMLDALIAWSARLLEANEPAIREMVHERAGWLVRLAGLDDRIADKIVEGLSRLIEDMAADPDHLMRSRAEQMLLKLAGDLRDDPAMRARVEAMKGELIANPAIGQWLEGLWDGARARVLAALQSPAQGLGGGLADVLRQLGWALEKDARLNEAVNLYARRASLGVVRDYGGSIVTLVSDTIRGWDARTVTDRLEAAVGRDLQYIRINGTIVGGLAGLSIHTMTVLI